MSLDTTVDAAQRQSLSNWLKGEYLSSYGGVPLGFVSLCHLGPPYVDHYLNLLGDIVEHFAATQAMPAPFDSARMMVRAGGYLYVEVHSDGQLLPVKRDGVIG